VIPEVGARVMGLDDPAVKMSKSLADKRGHAIRLLDDPKEIMRSFKRAVTDSGMEIAFSDDPEKAGVNNLLTIYKAVTGKSREAALADFADARGYGDLKVGVAEVVIEMLAPIQARYQALMQDPAELDRLLAIGAEQAAAVAQPKVDQMKEMMGLVLPR
jgi:tryptophanyl-tRNA synthetase